MRNRALMALGRFSITICLCILLTPFRVVAGVVEMLDDPLDTLPPSNITSFVQEGGGTCALLIKVDAALSLAEAVDYALCNSAQIKSAWQVVKLQAGMLGQARAAYLPSLSGSVSRLQNKVHYADSDGGSSSTRGSSSYLNLTWKLIDFGGRSANLAAAQHSLKAALYSREDAFQKLLNATVSAYFDVQTAQAALVFRNEARQIALHTLDIVIHREQNGAVSRADVLLAKAALAKSELAERRALADVEKATAVLRYTINAPPSTPLFLSPLDMTVVTEQRKTLGEWIAEAQQQHPAILAARAQVETARAKIDVARSEGLPSVGLTGNYYRNGYPNQGLQDFRSSSSNVGITLTIPIFEGFSRTYKVKEAQALAGQGEVQVEETERKILLEIVRANAEMTSSLGNLESSGHLLDAVKAALESSRHRYAKGAAELTELLNQQNSLAEAQQEQIRSWAEWQSARLRLLGNAGALQRQDID